jgi:hypothetical protein
MNHNKSALAIAVAAAVGGINAADAATYTAVLTQALTYSNNGSSAANINSSVGLAFTYDDVTNVLTQTAGTYNARFTITPTTTLYRHSITGIVIGNGAAATASTFVCSEGNFGGGVGASICGNYNFGANFVNDSSFTYGPGTASSRTLGGDDGSIGPLQTIANYDGMNTTAFNGTSLTISNGVCSLTQAQCSTTGGYNSGITWNLSTTIQAQVPVPAAVWLFGSALGLLGVARRKAIQA